MKPLNPLVIKETKPQTFDFLPFCESEVNAYNDVNRLTISDQH